MVGGVVGPPTIIEGSWGIVVVVVLAAVGQWGRRPILFWAGCKRSIFAEAVADEDPPVPPIADSASGEFLTFRF